ncbi:MAG TPA: zf-HC2 domain-containing protein, partial [Bacteroidales bacterium]|nr:zf-HC2 domain-containing protein [Bacteroidales bacterium]
DELSNEESDAVEKHLSKCEICSDFVDGVLMLESTESFLTTKEDLNQAITSNINKFSKKRKLNPFMFRAVGAVALILVICGTYFIIDLLLNNKKINQIQKDNGIVQTVKENEETEISGKNNEIAQTISESKETE